MDATYRNDLRELNELNFARFDAKLEQRIGDLRGEMVTGFAELRTELRTSLARVEGGLIARIGLAEGRLASFTAALWISTLAAVAALIKL